MNRKICPKYTYTQNLIKILPNVLKIENFIRQTTEPPNRQTERRHLKKNPFNIYFLTHA